MHLPLCELLRGGRTQSVIDRSPASGFPGKIRYLGQIPWFSISCVPRRRPPYGDLRMGQLLSNYPMGQTGRWWVSPGQVGIQFSLVPSKCQEYRGHLWKRKGHLRENSAGLFTTTPSHPSAFMKENSPCLSKLFCFMVDVSGCVLLLGLGRMARKAHWLNTWDLSTYLISMENSRVFVVCLFVFMFGFCFVFLCDHLSWCLSVGVMVTCSRTGRAWKGADSLGILYLLRLF